jgi:hypothetical protein
MTQHPSRGEMELVVNVNKNLERLFSDFVLCIGVCVYVPLDIVEIFILRLGVGIEIAMSVRERSS